MSTNIFPRRLARLSVLLSLTPLLLTGGLFAGPVEHRSGKDAKALTLADTWSLPGILGTGVKTTDEYTEGNVFLVLPVSARWGGTGGSAAM